ncbi:MAG: hypothetical protein EOO73_12835 [Myxococcales bacterium]|nr:MAG: hypothetical protein EOO73_12835 [Myxococcales bacterium]
MSTPSLLTSLFLVLLVSCGGVVERSSRDREVDDPAAPAPTELPSEDEPAGGIDPNADTALGECELGFPETYSKPCAWVAEDRCYDSRKMACNCACPRDRDSQCLSNFANGPDGHVWVACD